MSINPTDHSLKLSTQDDRLAEALEAYLCAAEGGDVDAAERICSEYPDVADDLRVAIEGLNFVCNVAPKVGDAVTPVHTQGDQPSSTRALPTLGDFRVLREIGRGGMGVVYEAEQISLTRRVALKVLPFAGLLDQRQLERFQTEARAAAMLKHPNIVSVYSVGYDRGVHHYSMELIEGQTLADSINKKGTDSVSHSIPDRVDNGCGVSQETQVIGAESAAHQADAEPSIKQALLGSRRDTRTIAGISTQDASHRRGFYHNVARIGVQAATALHYAHEQGVIHRDIKPSNLLLDRDGHLHIADFGLARIQAGESLTTTGDLIGTLRYMSPEQLEGGRVVDQRTDVYSLGLTLYEVIAGGPAFTGRTRSELVRQVLESNPKSLRLVDPSIPKDLATIVHKAIAKSQYERYDTASELTDDLQCFLDNRPVKARPAGKVQQMVRWCQRNPALAMLLSLITTLLLGSAIGGPMLALKQASLAELRRHSLYDRDMSRALTHIRRGEVDNAIDILRSHISEPGQTDFRKFEWFELVARCQRRLESQEFRFWHPAWKVAYAPNGDLAFVSSHQALRVLDSELQEKWRPKKEDTYPYVGLTDVCYSQDGEVLLSVGRDNWLKIWNAENGELLDSDSIEISPPSWPSSLAISSRGMIAIGLGGSTGHTDDPFPSNAATSVRLARLVIAESDGQFRARAEPVATLTGPVGVVHDLAFSPDGRALAAASEDNVLRIWDVASQQIVRQFDNHSGPLTSVAFSADGRQICSAGGSFSDTWRGGEAIVRDIETGSTRTVHQGRCIFDVLFTRNGRLFTSGSDGHVKVWDAKTGHLIEDINAHAGSIHGLALSPDQTHVASAGNDNAVRVWNILQLPRVTEARHESLMGIIDIDFSPDGEFLASASYDGGIRVWNPQSGKLAKVVGKHSHNARGVAFSPKGEFLASLGVDDAFPRDAGEKNRCELALWNMRTNVPVHKSTIDRRFALAIDYAPNGKHLAISGAGRLTLWNITDWRKEKEIEADTTNGFRVVFSRDGQFIGTPGGIWHYPSLQPLWLRDQSKDGNAWALAVHPESKTFATADRRDDSISIRSMRDPQKIIDTLTGHKDAVLCLAYSPDGTRLVSASQSGLVILWNLETGNEIVRYRNHDFWCFRAKFSPDGNILASCQAGRSTNPSIVFRRRISENDAIRLLDTQRQ